MLEPISQFGYVAKQFYAWAAEEIVNKLMTMEPYTVWCQNWHLGGDSDSTSNVI